MRRLYANALLVATSLGLAGAGGVLMFEGVQHDNSPTSIKSESSVQNRIYKEVGGTALEIAGLTGLMLSGLQVYRDSRQQQSMEVIQTPNTDSAD